MSPAARVDFSSLSLLILGVTTEPQRKLPDYDPISGLTRFEWVLAASQAIREARPERIAEEIQRINMRAKTHGSQEDRR